MIYIFVPRPSTADSTSKSASSSTSKSSNATPSSSNPSSSSTSATAAATASASKNKSEELLTVTLERITGRQLGIRLSGNCSEVGIYIVDIQEGSTTSLDGRLQRFDRILFINGQDVRHCKLKQASALIQVRTQIIKLLDIYFFPQILAPSKFTIFICFLLSEQRQSEHCCRSQNRDRPRQSDPESGRGR